ncbi:MAG TPA: tRNA pseudouridine(38-40) synthase TruA [Candidatus Mediterraneibacter stercorigallinarum]|uniref:tRNA pseudouridine synthase A n=1 Tax=Candidatus Mediterraneibacter stercorigallinarum TaxID=2838686 RepID=A0A9D2IJ21_9FIRM|nr:tRNA pseudouridine(38-40) synthase TruA [Candidatus Mediterraneibacter stercorigallinarum]
MRTYKLTIAYDGTRYQGWQRQMNTDRTIQGILEKVICEQTGYKVEINGSGRTDAGVHAKGQTASIVLAGQPEDGFFTEKINRFLPEDIRILDAQLVKNGFHARKSAVGKAYEYYIDTGEKPDVFTRRYCYHFPHELDLERMREAAGYLLGTHEFQAYTDKKDETSTKRTIYDIMISGQDGRVAIEYKGTGFLYHMVRILTGTLLEAGTHQRTAESVRDALRTKDRGQAGFLAPARGLFLKEVWYK